MPALLGLLIPALVPVLADGVRGVFNWVTGGRGALPANVDEAVKLMQAETAKLQAIAALDVPGGQISPWVANLRGSFRYIAAGIIITPVPFIAGYALLYPSDASNALIELYVNAVAGPVFAFMFGDRLRIHLRQG